MNDVPISLELAMVTMNDINAILRRCRLTNLRFKNRPGVVVVLS